MDEEKYHDDVFLRRLKSLFYGNEAMSITESNAVQIIRMQLISVATSGLKEEFQKDIKQLQDCVKDLNKRLEPSEDRPPENEECNVCVKHAKKDCLYEKIDTRCKNWEGEKMEILPGGNTIIRYRKGHKNIEDMSCTELFQETLVLIKEMATLQNENDELKGIISANQLDPNLLTLEKENKNLNILNDILEKKNDILSDKYEKSEELFGIVFSINEIKDFIRSLKKGEENGIEN